MKVSTAPRSATPSGGVSSRPRPLAPAVFSGAALVHETEPLSLSPSLIALGCVSPPSCPGGAEARPPGQSGVSGTGAVGEGARETWALPRKGAIA